MAPVSLLLRSAFETDLKQLSSASASFLASEDSASSPWPVGLVAVGAEDDDREEEDMEEAGSKRDDSMALSSLMMVSSM